MNSRSPDVTFLTVVATVVVALGACAIAASVMVPDLFGEVSPWVVTAGGFVAVVAGFVLLWALLRRRDRTLW